MSLKANEVKMAIFQYHRKHKTGPSPALVLGIGSTQDLVFRGEDANVHKQKIEGKKRTQQKKIFYESILRKGGKEKGEGELTTRPRQPADQQRPVPVLTFDRCPPADSRSIFAQTRTPPV